MEKTNYIQVSDTFVDIYKMFNVTVQTGKMSLLSRKELMLLLILAIDSFSENPVVIENFKNYITEMKLIHDLQEDEECTDVDLLTLGKETGENYIDTSKIRDSNGNELPTPLSEEQALQMRRDINISDIIE